MLKRVISLLFIIQLLFLNAFAQNDFEDLALTPPMGWNSWNTFRMGVHEDLIRETANLFVEKGLKDAGYTYIVIDDGWQSHRDENGNIMTNSEKFPSGIKALADYVHSKGLKFGIYSDAGYKTCGGLPGSRGYEYQDARTYASWGVDYLKYDWCHTGEQSAPDSYRLMKDALIRAGRPVVFSICEWGTSRPWTWAPEVGNLWRTTFDIRPCWDCGELTLSKGEQVENFIGFTKILDLQAGLESYAGPGHWNDPDMLEVGNGNLSYDENVAHFSLWCILAAPLILGNDIKNISDEVLSIITNKEVIAVNQDPLGRQGKKVRDDGDFEVWSKELHDGSRAVLMFNRSESEKEIQFSWSEVGLPQYLQFSVRDLWERKEKGKFSNTYRAIVPPHGVILVKVY
jgi:alpha-galactosidase